MASKLTVMSEFDSRDHHDAWLVDIKKNRTTRTKASTVIPTHQLGVYVTNSVSVFRRNALRQKQPERQPILGRLHRAPRSEQLKAEPAISTQLA
ncbi:hypothetical protein EVAR_27318_1 [Eumeta japonica]|uniref:Uncharacterized protein n=1 Tax=Eumeta variegata TaxID=151549 RepID=A0A4C1UDT9_EUMVA|nr:hypothetical protein EVAR_27318_1 [Eumeta japonica]